MRRPFSLTFTLFLACSLSVCLAASCSENGATSACPPLPRYQSSPFFDGSAPDASVAGGGNIDAQIARAVDAGCYTAPTLFPSEGGTGGVAPEDNGGARENSAGAPGAQH